MKTPRTWCLFGLLATWLFLAPGAARGQGEGAPCDIDPLLAEATALMQAGKRPEHVTPLIARAIDCPDGELSFDLNLYQAVLKLRSGQIREARRFARQAQKVAMNDAQRSRATLLVGVLKEELQEVTFVPLDGSAGPLIVHLEAATPGTLPDEAVFREILPRPLHRFLEGTWNDVLDSARAACAGGERSPLVVWLARGTYSLRGGQTIRIGGSESQTVTVVGATRPGGSTVVQAGLIEVLPLGRSRMAVGHGGAVGFSLHHVMPLSGKLMFMGEAGYYPVVLQKGPGGCGDLAPYRDGSFAGVVAPEQLECVALAGIEGRRVIQNLSLSAGIGRELTLGRSLPLMVGLSLRGIWFQEGVAVRREEVWASAVTHWVGLAMTPEARLFYRLKPGRRLAGDLVIGVSLGAGPSLYLLPGEDLDQAIEEDPEAYAFHPLQAWFVSFAGQIGARIRF